MYYSHIKRVGGLKEEKFQYLLDILVTNPKNKFENKIKKITRLNNYKISKLCLK